MLQIIIFSFLIKCCGGAQDYDAPYYKGRNLFHRMTALSRQIYDDAVRRVLELNEIRFLYEVSPEYESGYIMGEIIERYRKLMEEGRMAYINLKNNYTFRKHYATDLLLRIEKAQQLYFEVYHLVRMMQEIGPKYATYFKVHGNYDAMFDNPNAPKGGVGGKRPVGKLPPGKGKPGAPAAPGAPAKAAEVDTDDAYYEQMVNDVDENALDAGPAVINATANATAFNNTMGIDYGALPVYGQGVLIYPSPPPIKKYDHDAEAKKRKEAALQKEAERKAREEAYKKQVLEKIQDQQFMAEAQKHAFYGYEYVHAYTQIPTMFGKVAMDSHGSLDDLVDDPSEKGKKGVKAADRKRKKKPITPFDYGWMLDSFEY